MFKTSEQLILQLKIVLANSYALYLKTQNFHWNIESKHTFQALHFLFEEQYQDLAKGIDDLAEQIRQLGSKAPASFSAYAEWTIIEEGNIDATADEMLQQLAYDQTLLIDQLKKAIQIAQKEQDEGTADLLISRLRIHTKNRWILQSSL